MLVYRMENKHGIGPYQGDGIPSEIMRHHNVLKGRPVLPQFYTEGHKKYIFGCQTIGDLLSWFNGAFGHLIEKEYVVSIYDTTEDILADQFQCAFIPAARIEITQLKNILETIHVPWENPSQPSISLIDGTVYIGSLLEEEWNERHDY